MLTNIYDWVDFYKEFAQILLTYKYKRQNLISKVKLIYTKTDINLPTLEKDNNIVDIDPFTVFGLFNKSSMKEENRIKIISAISELFNVESKIPTDFTSIPVLNNQNATFYYFIDERAENDIDELWSFFEAAINYCLDNSEKNKETFSKLFDLTINKKGNGNSKITMGLYWVAPNSFLNLDKRNTWYIYESEQMPKSLVNSLPKIEDKISAVKYFDIIEKIIDYLNSGNSKFKDFKDLSHEAWRYSKQIKDENKRNISKNDSISGAAFLRWMKPLLDALKDLGGSGKPKEVRNKIIENEQLTEEEVNIIRGKNNRNKFENEVAFARNYLVYEDYIDKKVYGVWSLTEAGKTVIMTDELASEIFNKNVLPNKASKENTGTGLADNDVKTTSFWLYSPYDTFEECVSKKIMLISFDHIGDLSHYTSQEEMRNKMKELGDFNKKYTMDSLATWQFTNVLKVGDVVYAKKGSKQIIARGIVESDYFYDDTRTEYKNVRKINWTHIGEWEHPGQAVAKTLTDITSYTDYVNKLATLFDSEQDIEEPEITYPPYSVEKFLEEVYMNEDEYDTLVELLNIKKNIILQGTPGVGKTYTAKRLAYSLMGNKDQNKIMMIQFHQSYSYEDLIEGFRPTATGFEIKKGSLYNFCKKATDDLENSYFFIIDEINRGNISKIFGELFMLIENDKRGNALKLLYSEDKFSVPENVYIIGMMNTADRSLALIDYALRRRFAFYEMKPGFDSDGFLEYQNLLDNSKFDKLINCIKLLNIAIQEDDSLGESFCIGHSYFCDLKGINKKTLSNIVEYEIIPLIKEYWFDEPSKMRDWCNNLRGAIK